MRIKNIYIVLVLALVLTGCQNDDILEAPVNCPISFENEMQDNIITRVTYYPLFNFQKSMKVYGTKTISGQAKKVFPNYRLNYLTDNKAWVYEATKDASLTGQIVKYWDHDATQYDFIAGAPYDKTEISTDGKKVTIKDLKAELANASALIETPYLYSEPKTVASGDYDKTVMMTFHLAVCRVKVAFIFKDPQTGSPGSVTLTDITFTPSASGDYALTGDLDVNYSTGVNNPTYTFTANSSSSGALNFENITIDYPGNTTPVYAAEWYYMLPHSTTATACEWTMKVGSLTSKNTATVPKESMKWMPGHEYVYKFQLSSAETDPTIKFIECVNTAITGWTDATSSDVSLYNW